MIAERSRCPVSISNCGLFINIKFCYTINKIYIHYRQFLMTISLYINVRDNKTGKQKRGTLWQEF